MAKGKLGLALLMGAVAPLFAGCASSHALPLPYHDADNVPRLSRPPCAPPAVTAVEEPGSLEELLKLAQRTHPELRAASARIEVARGRMIQAGLYPNPQVGPSLNELGTRGGPWGEAGVRMTQTFVTAHKLSLARAAGAHGVEAFDWQALTRWYEVRTRVQFAYFELLTALREQEVLKDIVRATEEAWKTAVNLEKQGVGLRSDVLRAKVELDQNQLRLQVSQRRIAAAEQSVLTALGRIAVPLARLESNRQDLEQGPPTYDWNALLECVREYSSEVQEARAFVAQAETLVTKARADAVPNVTVTAIPYYVQVDKQMRNEVFVQVPLPIFDRNQGNIHAALADLARTRAEEQSLELRLIDRLTTAYQRYQAARQQAEAYQKNIVPNARESLKLIETGYKSGDRKYDYTTLLQAQQVLFQAQLAQTQALGELWRAVAELAGIVQQDNLHEGCGVRK